jgi:hypothetical protein
MRIFYTHIVPINLLQDLNPGTYNGPTIIADEMANCFPENRDKIKVMDIACGTGRVGEEVTYSHFYDNYCCLFF